jgi:adenine phosphoribosyltransferase
VAAPPSAEELRSAIPWVDAHADVWHLFADGALLGRCVTALVAPYRDEGVTHVAGIEARGFVLGGAAAAALGAGFVAIRKATGHLPGDVLATKTGAGYRGVRETLRLQADVLPRSGRILLVDDWVETGSQLLAARELIERTDATVVGVSVIVDQAEEAVHRDLARFAALVRADELAPPVER